MVGKMSAQPSFKVSQPSFVDKFMNSFPIKVYLYLEDHTCTQFVTQPILAPIFSWILSSGDHYLLPHLATFHLALLPENNSQILISLILSVVDTRDTGYTKYRIHEIQDI